MKSVTLHAAVQHVALFNILYPEVKKDRKIDCFAFQLKNMFFVWVSQHILSDFICFPTVWTSFLLDLQKNATWQRLKCSCSSSCLWHFPTVVEWLIQELIMMIVYLFFQVFLYTWFFFWPYTPKNTIFCASLRRHAVLIINQV